MAILYVWSGAAGSGSGADWTNAKITLTAAFTTEVAGDTLYVAHDHAESTAASITLTSSGTVALPTKIICVDRAGTVPPVSADRRTTGSVATTGASHISIAGFAHFDGIIFSAGSAANLAHIVIPSAGAPWLRFDNCSLRLASTAATCRINVGNAGSASGSLVELNNTTVSFAAVGQAIDIAAMFNWRNTPSALIGAAVPTILFIPSSNRGGKTECIGVDLSAAGSGKTIVGANSATIAQTFRLIDCKLDAAVTKSTVPTTHGTAEVDFIRSGATGNYTVFRHRTSGTLEQETTIVRSGGASDGTTPISWKVITTANCNYSMPFETPPIAIWNDTTGSAVTATVEGIGATLPNDDEVWLDISYLSSGSSPISSSVNDGKANLIVAAAAQTSSSETWGGSTAEFKLAVTFTPQQAGWIYARVKVGKASSTLYIDPLVTLS